MKTTSSTGSRRLLALMLSLLMTFGLWTADLRGAVAHAEVTPIETINDFELNAGGTVKATWDQTAQTLTVHGSGKIENGKWKELARKFSERNFNGYGGWKEKSDFTLRFESNAILLPDDTRIEDSGKFMGFFQDFDGEIELPADLNVSDVTNMYRMFSFAEKANPDVSAWDVSKVTDMEGMFYCAYEFRGEVSGWRPRQLETMSWMFGFSDLEALDLSAWGVQDVDAEAAFVRMNELKSLKFKGLHNVTLDNFKGSYSYTKDGGTPVNVDNPKEITRFEDNAEYHVFLQSEAPFKNITVQFLDPNGSQRTTESFRARKGESFTDKQLYDKFNSTIFVQSAPNTPDKVNIVGEENDITFKVQLKLLSDDPSKFRVDFCGYGESEFVLVPKNTPVPKPEDPQRPGHIFRGWYKEDTFDNEWSFTQPVNDDMLLFAKWERDTGAVFHTVTVIGGTSDLVTTSAGETVTVTANSAPSGQRFIGWSSDVGIGFEDPGASITRFLMPNRDVTITANFGPFGNLIVAFDSQGGSAVTPAYVAPNTPVTEPAPPTRAGYTFAGWHTGLGVPWNFSDAVTRNMTLYAKWTKKEYAITVVGGSSDRTTAKQWERVTITADSAPSGQQFIGWSSDVPTFFGNHIQPVSDIEMPASDVTITAHFAPIGELRVTFISQEGSSVPPVSVAPNTPVTEPAPPTREGYTFAGWHTGLGVPWNFSDPITRNMELIAVWIANTYTVTVIGGTSDIATAKMGDIGGLTADPAPSGQRFIGWSSDVGIILGNAAAPSTRFLMPASNVTITANFAPIGNLIVAFDSQRGSSVPSVNVAPNTPVAEPAPPTRAGYTFEGWYTDTAYTTPWNFSDPVTADMILYAKWSTGTSTYTVRVTGGISDLATAAAGARVTVTADPAPIGQRFVNWTSDVGVAFANVTTPSTTFVMPSSNVEVTANFAPIGHLAVSFDSQGGSAVAPAYVAPGTPAAPPVPPTRAGYTFDGWYTDTAYTTPWNFSDPVTADLVLYAKWNSSTSTGTGSGGGDKDKPEKPEMPKAPKEDLIQKPDIVEVFDESSPKHETKAPSAMKTAGVLKIGSLDYQALEKGVLVKKKLDTPPIIEKGKTMLPARAVGELLGVSVSYNSKSKTAVFVYEGKKVELTIGKKTMKVNGVEKAMSAPMMMRNGRVLLPLRDVQQALKELGLEASVNWEHKTKMITIQAKR